MSELYKQAGVDIERGDLFIEGIKKILKRYPVDQNRTRSGVGGFASLFEVGDRYLAAGSDGVGTKIKVAQAMDDFSTIGQDLVAMCLNDISCTGAKPLFFMDYLACNQLNSKRDLEIVEGIARACQASKCVLIGGETAEMPGCYPDDGVDLAGFGVGEVYEQDIISGENISQGDSIIAIESNGIHSNGLSFFRKWFNLTHDQKWFKQALKPTHLYSSLVNYLMDQKVGLSGVAHITGGGINNLTRLLKSDSSLYFDIQQVVDPSECDSLFLELQSRSGASDEEMYQVLNMGMGLIVIVKNAELVMDRISHFKDFDGQQFRCLKIGEVKEDKSSVKLKMNYEKKSFWSK